MVQSTADSLLLIPTRVERQWAGALLDSLSSECVVAECGFGAIVSGIRTTRLIAQYHPRRVWLLGIAGSLDPRLELGTALEFCEVSCYGIGIGTGIDYRTSTQAGWHQWEPAVGEQPLQAIGDTLPLASAGQRAAPGQRQLLTVCAASATAADVACRKHLFPRAQAEDMEGFAVAAACQMAQVPLRIIRGLANAAGDRDHRRWQSMAAMRAAATLTLAAMRS